MARAPGQALDDFAIVKLLAEAWGCGEAFAEWSSPEAVFRILARLSAGRPCDFSGVDGYDMVDELGGVQWPFPAGSVGVAGEERRLFGDGRFFHPDGRARFCFGEPRPVSEAPSRRYPLVLLTGRGSSSQWHTQTRTSKSALLRTLYPADTHVEVSPADADELGVAADEWVVVASARGSMRAKVLVTPTVRRGQVFIAMHDPAVNRLTNASFDPYSRQPSYKHCAVAVRPLEHWER